VAFKLDALNKIKRVTRVAHDKNPHLHFSREENPLEYIRDTAPIYRKELNKYELEVLVEQLALSITGTYNEMYWKIKKVYDSIYLFGVDLLVVLNEINLDIEGDINETKGFSGFTGQRPRDTK
jgi:hypothetical protein